MSLYKTEGIVLRNRDLGEADRIVTVYTRERGKVRAVAKGARRPRSRFVGSTLVFTYADFLIFKGKGLDNISQVSIIEPFSRLRSDLVSMAYASYMAELVDISTEEDEKNDSIFLLLLTAFQVLPELPDPEMLRFAFEARLMTYLGYKPVLDRCATCGGNPEAAELAFDAATGGVLCLECAGAQGDGAIKVSRGTVELLKRILNHDLRRIGQLKASVEVRRQLDAILKSHIDYHLDRSLKSREFLEMVRHTGRATS
ncbi:MAG TPA: DNA repair protein RecO [Firmicutes bacterium]|nr:DNA repair protein RecO [Bacillota bacterium]